MPSSTARTAFLKLARDRFELAQEAEKEQRDRERDDLRFYAGDQWPDDVRTIRAGQNAQNGLPPVPARPCLTINKTREPVRQVLNAERQSDMGIEIVPADDFGDLAGPIDETEIELREGLVRRIQRESEAADARTWAFARAVQAGRGYYGVMTRYAPGKTNDQEIYIHRYYNQSCVTLDPAHEQPDGSDAEWGFVGTDMPWDRYRAEYPQRNGRANAVCAYTDDQWRALGEERPGWFSVTGETRMARVVDYWYTERVSRVLVTLTHGDQERLEWADELEQLGDLEGWTESDRRTVVEKRIKWAKLDGCDDDVLDETDWPGPDLPIVKVLGEELQPFDEHRRVEGMIRPMREPGQMYNYMVTRWVELIGLAPLTPVMIEEGTIEGYEAWWQNANTRTLPYLPYKRTNLEGMPGNPPIVAPARNPDVAAIAGSIQVFDEAIQATSGIHDPSLGKVDPSVKSGRAIRALQDQAARSSNHYLDNLQRSLRYEGQIINNLLYPIYSRPGRIARLLDKENQPQSVRLHQPMVMRNGRPVPAPEQAQDATRYTLTKDAKFNVIVKIAKNFDSRREQEAAILGELLQAHPELMSWFGDLYFQNQDGPGHRQMAERAKLMLAPPIQQMLAAKAQGASLPPEVQAQLTSAQAQIQQLQAELQKAQAPGMVETIKQQGESDRHVRDLLFDRLKLHTDSETKLAVAELGAKVDRLALFLEERARLGLQASEVAKQTHEVGMAAMQAGTAADAASAQRQAEQEAASAQRTHEQTMASQQHAAEAAQQQAAQDAAAKQQGA